MDDSKILQFKGKIASSKMTIQQFAKHHKFNAAVFNQAINGHTAMKPEYERAINHFVDPETRLYMLAKGSEKRERLGGELKNLVIPRLFPDGNGSISLHRTVHHQVYEWLHDIAEKEALGTNVRRDAMNITDILDEFDSVELTLE